MGKINRKRKNGLCLIVLFVLFLNVDAYSSVNVSVRDTVEAQFMKLNGIREATGRNDGKEIKEVLATCGLKEGQPYCAATVNWTLINVGIKPNVKNPAYSPNWFIDKSKIVYQKNKANKNFKVKKAQIFGMYFPEMGRVAHVGFIVYESSPTSYVTFEGNTSFSGAIEPDGKPLTQSDREAGVNGGFTLKKRNKNNIYIITDYLTEYENGTKDWRKARIYSN